MKGHVVLIMLLLVLGSCFSTSASEENLPARGTKQLMFGFSGWHLNNYRGGVGLRYYLREKTAIRFGLDVNWTKDDDTGWDHDIDEGEEPRQSTNTLERSSFSTGLGAVLERHFRSSWSVVPYTGLGAFYWYERTESDRRVQRENGYSDEYETKGYTIEGLLLAGLQWHFAPNMSLGGEYRMSLKYSYKEYESTYTREERQSIEYDARKDYTLTLDSSRLWLSIAF